MLAGLHVEADDEHAVVAQPLRDRRTDSVCGTGDHGDPLSVVGGHRSLVNAIAYSPSSYWMVKPPSTMSVWPVIQALSSDSRNTAGPAMSSGVPIRRSGSRSATADDVVPARTVDVGQQRGHHRGT